MWRPLHYSNSGKLVEFLMFYISAEIQGKKQAVNM